MLFFCRFDQRSGKTNSKLLGQMEKGDFATLITLIPRPIRVARGW